MKVLESDITTDYVQELFLILDQEDHYAAVNTIEALKRTHQTSFNENFVILVTRAGNSQHNIIGYLDHKPKFKDLQSQMTDFYREKLSASANAEYYCQEFIHALSVEEPEIDTSWFTVDGYYTISNELIIADDELISSFNYDVFNYYIGLSYHLYKDNS